MLRWSALETARWVNLTAIVNDHVDPGVDGGRELVSLGRATQRSAPHRAPLAGLAQRIGLAAAVDAAAVAANFQVMNRVVDATGLPIGTHAQDAQRDVIDQLGLAGFRHSGR
jgi:hypothetical protein